MLHNRFSLAAPDYDAHAVMQKRVVSKLLHTLTPFIRSGNRIIDAGCGPGAIADLLKDVSMLQIDNAYGMCRQAQGKAPIFCADVSALPFRCNIADIYLSSLCWQWVKDVPLAIAQAQHALRERGIIAVATLLNGSCKSLYDMMNQYRLPLHTPHYPEYNQLRDMLLRGDAHMLAEDAWHEVERFPTSFAMMRAFHDIGATLPANGRNMTALRRVLRHYQNIHKDGQGVTITYHIGLFIVKMGKA